MTTITALESQLSAALELRTIALLRGNGYLEAGRNVIEAQGRLSRAQLAAGPPFANRCAACLQPRYRMHLPYCPGLIVGSVK